MRALRLDDWAHQFSGLRGRLIPIAADPAQGVFCYDIRRGTRHPPIVHVSFNFDPDEDKAIRPVASSFTALLEMLGTGDG